MSCDTKACLKGFRNRSHTNQAVQLQKIAGGLKFRNKEVEGLDYLCSENKGADQLCSYCWAVLRLLFSTHAKKRGTYKKTITGIIQHSPSEMCCSSLSMRSSHLRHQSYADAWLEPHSESVVPVAP